MDVVRLKGICYQHSEYIGICFENNAQVDAIIRRHPSCRWSKSNKCWLIRLSRENYNKLVKQLEEITGIENADLKSYLAKRNKSNLPKDNKLIPGKNVVLPSARVQDHSKLNAGIERNRDIKEVNHHVLPAMEQQLKLKCYSKSTIKTYLNEMAQLLRILNNRPADYLTEEEIKRYLVYCYEKVKLSENTLHSRINALKFYFEQVVKRDRFFWNIPRPRKHLQIPRLLNEVELARLFNSLSNKKHKAMLFTAYSAGLRVSEVVNLKLENIAVCACKYL
jgi:integrase/recombinase XerD